jgi:hypothetical protein
MKLLSIGTDSKTVKGRKLKVMTAILYLAPANRVEGLNLCPFALHADCLRDCLYSAGRAGIFKAIPEARIRKTEWFRDDLESFMSQIVADIESARIRARKARMKLAIRLNGTSDILWETIPVTRNGKTYPNVMTAFPRIQFYDYTKVVARLERPLPANYDLTFSFSGTDAFRPFADRAIAAGARMSVVFVGAFPETFMGMPVVSGDDTDVRFYDPAGVIVALKAKGSARKTDSAFVVRIPMIAA